MSENEVILWEIFETLSSPDIPFPERFMAFLKFVRSYRFPRDVYPKLKGMIEELIEEFYKSWELIVLRFPVITDSKLMERFSDKTYDPGHLENFIEFLGKDKNEIFLRRKKELRILMVEFIREMYEKYPDQDPEVEGIELGVFDFYRYVSKELSVELRGYRWFPMNSDINLLQEYNILWYVGKDERLYKR